MPKLNLKAAIRRFNVPKVANRYVGPSTTNAEGLKVTPAKASIPDFKASVHPATGAILDRLPEGQRTRRTIVAYTLTRLNTADEEAGLLADEIEHDGADFQVELSSFWDWGRYYEIIAQEVRH